MGAGYAPLTDVGASRGDMSPAQTACRKTMHQAGQDTSSPTAFYYMVVACDVFSLLEQGLEAGREPTVAGLRNGIERLGDRFVSAAVVGISWSANRYDGVAATRDLQFRDGRFVYVSGPARV
jgi:hypothetical protein